MARPSQWKNSVTKLVRVPESLAAQILEVAKWLDDGGAISFVTEPEEEENEDRGSVAELPTEKPRTLAEFLKQEGIDVSQIRSRDLTCPYCRMSKKLERNQKSHLGKQRWKCRSCDRRCSEGTALLL